MLASYVLLGVMGLLGAGTLLIVRYRSDTQRRRRDMRHAPLWSVASLPEGVLGRVVGTTRALGAGVTAPLSGRPCLCYSVRAFFDEGSVEEAHGVVFELEDGTGVATIDPEGASSGLVAERFASNWLTGIDAAQREFMERVSKRDLRSYPHPTGFEEAIVEANETIAVLGFGLRGAGGKLHLKSMPRFALVIADDPKTTKIEIPEARVERS